ncbi:MAG: hypothetical protein LBU19_02580, partial [Treponema sp.]|nr:hypothetical protein [Treponema sp.]
RREGYQGIGIYKPVEVLASYETVQDYRNDPRFLNDPGMSGALEPVKEIHAIRLKIQDEMAEMSLEEKIDSLNKEADAMGFSL